MLRIGELSYLSKGMSKLRSAQVSKTCEFEKDGGDGHYESILAWLCHDYHWNFQPPLFPVCELPTVDKME